MTAETFANTADDAAAEVESAAAKVGSAAADKIDGKRGAAANLAQGAADKLSSTADYIREHDLGDMVDDVKTLVKKNPMPAIVGAAALGFILAKAFSTRD